MPCSNCGKSRKLHCEIHVIPCCPGKCPGPARPDRSIPREYPLSMSGEDQRHTYHEDELNELVDSRVTLEDGRIVEYPPLPIDGGGGGAPATNPPNVIGGNNADL